MKQADRIGFVGVEPVLRCQAFHANSASDGPLPGVDAVAGRFDGIIAVLISIDAEKIVHAFEADGSSGLFDARVASGPGVRQLIGFSQNAGCQQGFQANEGDNFVRIYIPFRNKAFEAIGNSGRGSHRLKSALQPIDGCGDSFHGPIKRPMFLAFKRHGKKLVIESMIRPANYRCSAIEDGEFPLGPNAVDHSSVGIGSPGCNRLLDPGVAQRVRGAVLVL